MLHTFPLLLASLSKYLLIFKDVFKTSSRHVLKTLQYFFSVTIFRSSTTSCKDVFKTSRKTSWRRLERRKIVTLKTYWRRLHDMSWRRLEDMSWRSLEDMSWRRLEDISWRRLEGISWRCLQNVLESNKMFSEVRCI